MSEERRMIPLTNEFMKDKTIYDRIWTHLQINSYIGYDSLGNKHRFVYTDITDNLKILWSQINTIVTTKDGHQKDLFSYKTFLKAYKKFFDKESGGVLGYITKGKILSKDKSKEIDVLFLKDDFKPFQSIPLSTLIYLMSVSNNNVIKIYAYLLNCFSYKGYKSGYTFTKEELTKAIGYNSDSFYWNIDYILEALESFGLISYGIEAIPISKTTVTYKYVLYSASYNRTNEKVKPSKSNDFFDY